MVKPTFIELPSPDLDAGLAVAQIEEGASGIGWNGFCVRMTA